MKKLFIRLFLALLFLVLMVGCVPRNQNGAVKHPTEFKCFQKGVKILDVKTLNGAIVEDIGGYDYFVEAWVWDDLEGHQSLTITDDLSCSQKSKK